MSIKKLLRALIFPPLAVMIILIPISVVLLVYSMLSFESTSPVCIASYCLAFYTLSVWCLKIPYLIKFFKSFKNENKYARMWLDNARLRILVSLYGGLIWNTAYGLLQLGMGFRHRSYWFTSLAAYYIILAVMRFFLLHHARRHRAGEKMLAELYRYRACGVIFLVMNLALSLMVFFMVYWNRSFEHHEITTIALAAYTFTSLALAIVNIVKYRRYASPVYSASKAISLASACVSMLTLESSMLTTFGKDSITLTERRIFLALSGAAISAFIVLMAVYMIVNGTKQIRSLRAAKEQ